ncbi:MAG: hypothetical protein RQ866_09695 [Bacteroidales bacterium]|nr:hypothetical protein [Bacteroidales bacterium]
MTVESALLVYEFTFYPLKFNNCQFDVKEENSKIIAIHEWLGSRISSVDNLN